MVGDRLSHYEILSEIGRGGMGVVYRARDTKLNRDVALKLLPAELLSDPERKRRFVREAQAAAALKHPNIAVVYEIDESAGATFIALELIEGERLSEIVKRGLLPEERALYLATSVARGLAHAHEHGVVHRDLKPANIMVTDHDEAKIIDFGLAKLVETFAGGDSEDLTVGKNETVPGRIMGTVAYMSPEQARGQALDVRSDIFSFGVVLYELLVGNAPFHAPSTAETLSAILKEPHARLPKETNASLASIVDRCLEKSPDDRFQSMHDVVGALASLQTPRVSRYPSRWVVGAASLVLFFGIAGWFWIERGESDVRWARETAMPELERLIAQDDYPAAFSAATSIEQVLGGDPRLEELWLRLARPVTIRSTPEGADVAYRPLSRPDAAWSSLGTTPIEAQRLPLGFFWLRFDLEDFETYEALFWSGGPYASPETTRSIAVALDRIGDIPSGMVRIPGGEFGVQLWRLELPPTKTSSYLFDRHEVTNREYEDFVNAGGYRERRLWRHEFRDGEQHLDWEEALALFVDQTGRPGPAVWEVGAPPVGKEDHPVAGVSWFEAAAYCESLGKELPTVFHWANATATWAAAEITSFSNFGEGETVAAGVTPPGPLGTYDMAGNVKEWTWNETSGKRYLLGGAFNEPTYLFYEPDARSPFTRGENVGFRCALYPDLSLEPIASLRAPIPVPTPSYEIDHVDDSLFEAYTNIFDFDPVPLDPRVVETQETSVGRRVEVAFRAGYGDEEARAFLFLPTSHDPPFQTVIYFPGASAWRQRTVDELQTRMFDFLVKSGRAVMYPIYKGTHERASVDRPRRDSRTHADYVTYWMTDLRRSIDYLETRNDIRKEGLGYYGFSWGAKLGPIVLALEDRLSAAVLLDGGLDVQQARPEVREHYYAPRVSVPVLMLNGEFDTTFPLESSQKPLFELLGSPEEEKQHVTFPAGHSIFVRFRNQAITKILDWFDRYLGPVS